MADELAGLLSLLDGTLDGLAEGAAAGRGWSLPEAARVPVAAALAARHVGPTLYLAPTPARALAVAEEAGLFLGASVPVVRLPERERLPYEMARDDRASGDRTRALALLSGDEPALVVASWAAMTEHCAGPEARQAGLDVAVGDRHGPVALVRRLETLGYEAEHIAERPGSAARRGGIVDVFPVGADRPVRIEFFGDDVESIRLVDLASQRSVERVTTVHLAPAVTGTETARVAAAALLEGLEDFRATGEGADVVIEQLELVADGNRSDFAGFLEPLLYSSTACDWLNGRCQAIVDSGEEGETALVGLIEHETRTRTEQEHRLAIPPGLSGLRIRPEQATAALRSITARVEFLRFGGEGGGMRRLPFRVVPGFAGRLKPFAQQCGAWAKEGRTVIVASQQALRLAEILETEGIPADVRRVLGSPPDQGTIRLVPIALSGGFMLDEQFVLATDAEIFGFRKRRRPARTRTGVRSDLVSTLEVGDYLVHADHGISRYGGLTRRTVEGTEKEYLELQYAEGRPALCARRPARFRDALRGAERPPTLVDAAGLGRMAARATASAPGGHRDGGRAVEPLCAAGTGARPCVLGGWRLADGDGSRLPLRGDRGTA